MSTDTLARGSLNSFSGLPAGQAQPSEEEVYIFSASQLEDLIGQAVARAQAPLLQELHALQERIESLEEEVECGKEGEPAREPEAHGEQISLPQVVQDLQEGNLALKQELDVFQDFVALERMKDRQRIAKLEQADKISRNPAPGTKSEARIKALREILKQRGSTTFKEIERILKISPREMLRLTGHLDMRQYEIFRRQGDGRQKVIRLRAQIST